MLEILSGAVLFVLDRKIKSKAELNNNRVKDKDVSVDAHDDILRETCNCQCSCRCKDKLFGKIKSVREKYISLTLHHNYGSAVNLGAGKPAIIKATSVILTAVVSMIFVLSLTTGGNRPLRTGLSLLLGGAFSNTYDRIKHGYVIDYVSFNTGPSWFRRLVWNIADFGIIIGALTAALASSTAPDLSDAAGENLVK